MIKLKYQSIFNELSDLKPFREIVLEKHNLLHGIPSGDKNISDWTGWLTLPANHDENNLLLKTIEKTKKRLKRMNVDTLVVVGVGGSFLGTRAIYDIVNPSYIKRDGKQIELVFIGYTLNQRHLKGTLEYLKNKNFAINIVSRGGSTLEIKVASNLLQELLKKKYKKQSEVDKRTILTTTDGSPLHKTVTEDGRKCEVYFIPNDVGGRYSTLTPCGLLPLGVAGVNVKELLQGAFDAYEELLYPVPQNPAYLYACSRAALYSWVGCNVELGVSFEPSMEYFMHWWRMIFAESEGKNGWGLFPGIALFTSELHSLGQWIQDGDSGGLFETFHIVRQDDDLHLDAKQLSEEEQFLVEPSISRMEYAVMRGVLEAHSNRELIGPKEKVVITPVPHIVFEWEDYKERTIGYAMYYMQKTAAMYCLLVGVNPFNQPGVEAYKIQAMKHIKGFTDIYVTPADEIIDDYVAPNLSILEQTEEIEEIDSDVLDQEITEVDRDSLEEEVGRVVLDEDYEDDSLALREKQSNVVTHVETSVLEEEKPTQVVEATTRVKVGVEEIGEIRITIRPKRKLKLQRDAEINKLAGISRSQVNAESRRTSEKKKTTPKPPVKKAATPKKVAPKTPAKKAAPKKVAPKTPAKKATPKKVAPKSPVKKAAPKKGARKMVYRGEAVSSATVPFTPINIDKKK